jgi:putative ABC transport system permease protein
MPNYGDVSGGKPGMVVQASPRDSVGSSAPPKQKLITDESLTELAALPGVIAVIPRDYIQGPTLMRYNKLEGGANIIGIGTKDLSLLGLSAKSGTLSLEKGTVIIGSMVANNFYDPKMRTGQQAPSPPELQDQQLKLILIKYSQDGIETRKTLTVRVVGVIAESKGESDYSIYAPMDDIASYNQWFTGKRINRRRDGYNQAMVKVDKVENVIGITDQITSLGYQAYTPQSFVQGINSFFVVLQVIFGGVGAIALLVAAIGIANTMAMAILERTREIGLMKAVGATNRDVLSVFLGEAAGIGFIGGIGGVILGWSAGRVIDVLALAYLSGQAAQQGGAPPSLAVYTPLWLPVFALVFATLVGLVSGLYPALRAATLVPVNALKYE